MTETRSQLFPDGDRHHHGLMPPTGFELRSCPSLTPPEGLELSIVCMPFVRPAAVAIHQQLNVLTTEGIIADSAAGAIFGDLANSLWHSLFTIVSRSMVMELAAAKSTGLLQGETEAERYGFFVDCLADEDFALSILEECPALYLLVETCAQNWLGAVGDLLVRLSDDFTLIEDHVFNGSAPGAINRIGLSHGDRHRHGRSVAIIDFMSGRKLVYKPRSLAADMGFADFTDWFNAKAGERLLASVSSLDCGDHGWCAFVDPQPVQTYADLETYYSRLGALLAVARILGLSDLHAENLIAAGAWPTIIDLETLFHPPVRALKSKEPTSPAKSLLLETLDRSVLASGLLPIRADRGTGDDELDLAGMSDSAGQRTPFETPYWNKTGTDEMALGFARQTLAGDANVPVLNGERISPEPFAAQVLSGFQHAYAILQDNKHLLLSDDGPLSPFKGAAVRVVLRPTQYYSALLLDGSHPTILQSPRFKSNWLREALKVPNVPSHLDTVTESEVTALLRQDIPYFETDPHSRGVRACDGMVRPHFLPESGFEASKKVIAALGAHDLSSQVWLITLCLTKTETTTEVGPNHGAVLETPENVAVGKKNPSLEVAHLAARQVMSSAIRCGENATWLTAQEGENGTLVCKPAGLDLYGGLPGIALFLTSAGSVLECRDCSECGKAALCEILDALEDDRSVPSGPGGYSGLGGLAYALDQAQPYYPDLPLSAKSYTLLRTLDLIATEDLSLEVIDGLAGLMSCLSAMVRTSREERIIEPLLNTCRAVVLKLAALESGAAMDPILSQQGAAHGIAGLKGALAGLHLHGVPDLSDLAEAALSDLHRLQEKGAGLEPRGANLHRIAWCNGLTGLLVNETRQGLPDPLLVKALLSGLQDETYRDDSLCHGSMGAVLALNAARPDCTAAVQIEIDQASATILARILDRGPQCGTINGVSTPGLMDGLAGAGLAALILSVPGSVPVVPGLQTVRSLRTAQLRNGRA